jgi:hypothetical protein
MDIGEDWVLGVERDELDVEYVALYTLEKGESGNEPQGRRDSGFGMAP